MDKGMVEHLCNSLEKLLNRLKNNPKVYIVYFSEKLWTQNNNAKNRLDSLFKRGVKFIASSEFWKDNKERNMIPENAKISLKEALEELIEKIKI